MAAVTPTEISTSDIPGDLASGDHNGRVLIFVRATSAGTSDTLNLSTYVKNLEEIVGIWSETLDAATNAGTKNTWNSASATVKFDGHAGQGNWKLAVLGRMGK